MTRLTRMLALSKVHRSMPYLRRGYIFSVAAGLCLFLVQSPVALADTVIIPTSPVPLPSTWIAMLSGLGMLGFLAFKREKMPADRR